MEQRPGAEEGDCSPDRQRRRWTRRGILAGAAGVGASALGGCLASGTTTVSVLSAGSLARAFEERVGPAFGEATAYGFQGTYYGSRAVMRLVEDGQRRPDVVVSADASLLRDRLQPESVAWDVVFATNALVIAYNPETAVGARLDAGEPWQEALRDPEARIARTDPDLDPLGYRAIQLFDLAESYYDEPGLRAELRANTTVEPEEAHLLSAVETGERGAAIAYRNMAHDWDLPAVDLPAELDFSEPSLSEHYATATYTTDVGETLAGRPIRYNAAVPDSAANPAAGRAFARFLAEHPDRLREAGLVVPEGVPSGHGDVPAEVLP